MKSLQTFAVATVLASIVAVPPVHAGGFVDVLETPAQMSALATKSLLVAVTKAGDRLVAVGQRGQIVVSADGGATWKQSPVPVSSDLTGVYFVDDRQGWAVGHDGVVLHTNDAGDHWQMQLDGRSANTLVVDALARTAAADASERTSKLVAEAKRYQEQGADKPFLDVWFANAADGWVVGAFNLVFHTSDGGKSWTPWFDRTDNPKLFNLYAIRPVAGELYIAGEGGLLMKLDAEAKRFRALQVPYEGSFFGLAAAGKSVVAFGLRGTAIRSDDGGSTWVKVDTTLPASIVASATLSSGALVLADATGRVARSVDEARTFAPVALAQRTPLTALVEAGAAHVAITGPRGVSVQEFARD